MTSDLSLFSRATTLPSMRSVGYMHYICRRNNFQTLNYLILYAVNYFISEMIQTYKAENVIFSDGKGYHSVENESESSAVRSQSEPKHGLYADITLRGKVQD
jgi:hypothetical protein